MPKLYQQLANLVDAYQRCKKTGNEFAAIHLESIESLVRNHMPSGAGFDRGTKLDLGASTGEKLVFWTSFHHMNDGGFYDGWTDHRVTVRPSMVFDINLTISGRDRNEIKDYIAEGFDVALRNELANAQG
jgi:hypothetical protein